MPQSIFGEDDEAGEDFEADGGMSIKSAPIEEWTADDEGKLQRLKCSEIDLADTAVGRKKELMQQQFRAGGADLSDDEFNQIIELRKRKREENSTD